RRSDAETIDPSLARLLLSPRRDAVKHGRAARRGMEPAIATPDTTPEAGAAIPAGNLEARLRRLEDERAVHGVLVAYARTIDHGPDEEWLDLFGQDAALEIRFRQSPALA